MFTDVTSRRMPKERAPPATFCKKKHIFLHCMPKYPKRGCNTRRTASGIGEMPLNPTKVHLQAYSVIRNFAAYFKRYNRRSVSPYMSLWSPSILSEYKITQVLHVFDLLSVNKLTKRDKQPSAYILLFKVITRKSLVALFTCSLKASSWTCET